MWGNGMGDKGIRNVAASFSGPGDGDHFSLFQPQTRRQMVVGGR